tara:strand:- start:401 stop:730 length:330 start_codon:yes stop_codon:yes gene_type:complete
MPIRPRYIIYDGHKKIGVFEVAQQGQITGDTDNEPNAHATAVAACHDIANNKIEDDGERQKKRKFRIPPTEKDERRQYQPDYFVPPFRTGLQEVKSAQSNREKPKQEYV